MQGFCFFVFFRCHQLWNWEWKWDTCINKTTRWRLDTNSTKEIGPGSELLIYRHLLLSYLPSLRCSLSWSYRQMGRALCLCRSIVNGSWEEGCHLVQSFFTRKGVPSPSSLTGIVKSKSWQAGDTLRNFMWWYIQKAVTKWNRAKGLSPLWKGKTPQEELLAAWFPASGITDLGKA